MSLRKINANIAKTVSPHIELVKGEGYCYFVLDMPADGVYETRSIMTPYISDQTPARWIDDARSFAADMGL